MYLIGKSETIGIPLPPSFRQTVGLCFVRQIAVELNVWELCVPQSDDPLGCPNIRTQAHTDTKLIESIVDCLSQFALDGLSHPLTMERKRIRVKLPRSHADNAAGRVF